MSTVKELASPTSRLAFRLISSLQRNGDSVSTEVRREHEIARQLLAEREKKMLLAARLSPPAYVVKELGARPADPEKAKAWDRGVRSIESYRNERGVTDKDNALGQRPKDSLERTSHDHAQDPSARPSVASIASASRSESCSAAAR